VFVADEGHENFMICSVADFEAVCCLAFQRTFSPNRPDRYMDLGLHLIFYTMSVVALRFFR
jgi:hypothetical protein